MIDNTMREIFKELKKKNDPLMNTSEATDFWAEFGYKVFEKYLQNEILLEKNNIQLNADLKFLGTYIKDEDKKIFSERLKELIK